MDSKDWRVAIDVYRQALLRLPKERSFSNNVNFIAQEWLKELNPDESSTVAMINELRQQFSDVRGLDKIFTNYYMRSINDVVSQGEYERAESIAMFATDVLEDNIDKRKTLVYLYDTWARSFVDKQQWQDAVAVYGKAQSVLPNSSRVKQNAVATWHMWAKVYLDKKDWDGAIAIYEKGLMKLPGTALFKQNIKYCQRQKER